MQSILGKGGMGAVYKARQTSVERDIALKVILGKTTSDLRGRFMLEAKLTSSLQSVHTVTIFDFGVFQSPAKDDVLYLAMEFLEGRSLEDKLDDVPQLTWRESLKIVSAIAESLEEAHEKGIVHRDLKPANIHLAKMGSDPEFVKDIIEASYEPCLAYGKALVDAGADMIYITNPTASADCISREHYEEFVHASSRKMHQALKAHGAEVVFFHPCGRWEDRLDLLLDLEVDVLHFDNLDVGSFKSEYDGKCVYMGNVHSIDTLLSGTTTDVENETLDCLRNGAPGGGYILGANCAVPKDTDAAHVRAMAEGIRHHGQYGRDG